ncbi:nitroreductase family protein [Rhodococcus aetherivorans]|uniref:nitroreductase family protein n=1 Tax=Rhodococcus aetherivorans TaxID=191292 RepID=UPI00365EDAE9
MITAQSYAYDAARFIRRSGLTGRNCAAVLEAHIVMDYHRIEKGLTLPSPKPWFGREAVERLVSNCEEYSTLENPDLTVLAGAVGALQTYQDAFCEQPSEWWVPISARIDRIAGQCAGMRPAFGGVKPVTIPNLRLQGRDFDRFLLSRSSVRNYGDAMVDAESIERAISLAQKTPSVCNRQPTRVRVFERGPAARALLSTQNGNRGFGAGASHVLLLTTDLTAFVTPGERNQGFIDGGMFAMSLILALHAQGIGTCCLNWSAPRSQDRLLRNVVEIPEHEAILMMISLGYPTDRTLVTISPSRDFSRVVLDGNLRSTPSSVQK